VEGKDLWEGDSKKDHDKIKSDKAGCEDMVIKEYEILL
jgi:hypothetical protein